MLGSSRSTAGRSTACSASCSTGWPACTCWPMIVPPLARHYDALRRCPARAAPSTTGHRCVSRTCQARVACCARSASCAVDCLPEKAMALRATLEPGDAMTTTFVVDEIRTLRDLEALRSAWDHLAGPSAEPMQTHAWTCAAVRTLHAGARLRILAVQRGAALAAVAPLVEV